MSPNHVRAASKMASRQPRHGKSGYVLITLDVPPELKDRLAEKARIEGTSLVAECRLALAWWVRNV